jgi:hypothetical protein
LDDVLLELGVGTALELLPLLLLLLLLLLLRRLLWHHLAAAAHVRLEVCCHGSEGSTEGAMWILAQVYDPALRYSERCRIAQRGEI